MNFSHTLALVAALLTAGAGTAMAGMSSSYVEMRQQAAEMHDRTIGEQLASGKLTMPQVVQLIQFTGLSPDDAKAYTVSEVVAMRWTGN